MKRFLVLLALVAGTIQLHSAETERRLLYVAVPGIRNYLEYGGHGLLVFDIDDGHKFVKRIKTSGFDAQGKAPLNVKGICASAATKRVYINTTRTMTCLDLVTEKIVWEKALPGGCDRMAISPDGKTIYSPSLEAAHWNILDATSGEVITKITPDSGAHNTIYGPDGTRVYLAGLRSPWLAIADARTHTSNTAVGPFSAPVRPFTINGSQTMAFCCVNDLLGFEVGDIRSGKVMHRVEVKGFTKGTPKRHGCPSHGAALTPDESELWLCDAANQRVHVFDATVMPPKQKTSIKVRKEPGWVTFTIKGDFAYPSTGDVIDPLSKKIVAHLTDEQGAAVHSEKMLEIDVVGNVPVRTGDQFGIGREAATLSRK